MRKATVIVIFTAFCMAFTGCREDGRSEEVEYVYAEIPNEAMNMDNDSEKGGNINDDKAEKDGNNEVNGSNESRSQNPEIKIEHEKDAASENDSTETNIHGTVIGVGKFTVTMNRAFTAEYTPDGKYIDANTMVSFEDEDKQAIEYVQFMEESTFTLRETKNSGADSKDSPAAFEDIKKGDLLDIRGYYVDGIFNAVNTIIYRNLDI